jgi:hypothetical protein
LKADDSARLGNRVFSISGDERLGKIHLKK